MSQEKDAFPEGSKAFQEGTDYHDFVVLIQRMGFTENKVNYAEELGDYEFMCQIDTDGGLLVSLMTNMGDTMFRFHPVTGKHIPFYGEKL